MAAAVFGVAACGAAGSGAESAAGSRDKQASADIFAMDTYMTVSCYGAACDEALEASLAEIRRLDDLLSIGRPDSEINRLRQAGGGKLSADTAAIVREALEIYAATDGAFDFTVTPLMELWGFTTGDHKVPSDEALKEALAKVGSDRLVFAEEEGTLAMDPGQAIDPGGIAKGYTSDRLMAIFREYDLTAGLVSLGGNVQSFGTKPDGTYWRCGIQDPKKPGNRQACLGVLETADEAVVTSGVYERFFTDEESGRTYHHILDPATGRPADSGLISATIVSESGIQADGLSTAVCVMGLDGARAFWQNNSEAFDMILMTETGDVYVTEPLSGRFSSTYPVTVIHEK